MKTPTAQTALALPLRTGEDSEGDAYVIDSNESRLFKAWFAGNAELAELVRIVNAHTELVSMLNSMINSYPCECELLRGEECDRCKACKILAKSTGQTQV